MIEKKQIIDFFKRSISKEKFEKLKKGKKLDLVTIVACLLKEKDNHLIRMADQIMWSRFSDILKLKAMIYVSKQILLQSVVKTEYYDKLKDSIYYSERIVRNNNKENMNEFKRKFFGETFDNTFRNPLYYVITKINYLQVKVIVDNKIFTEDINLRRKVEKKILKYAFNLFKKEVKEGGIKC